MGMVEARSGEGEKWLDTTEHDTRRGKHRGWLLIPNMGKTGILEVLGFSVLVLRS